MRYYTLVEPGGGVSKCDELYLYVKGQLGSPKCTNEGCSCKWLVQRIRGGIGIA